MAVCLYLQQLDERVDDVWHCSDGGHQVLVGGHVLQHTQHVPATPTP